MMAVGRVGAEERRPRPRGALEQRRWPRVGVAEEPRTRSWRRGGVGPCGVARDLAYFF